MCLTVNSILHVNLQCSIDVLGELNSENSGEIHGEGGERERNKEDLSGNGEHAVKRATEQSVQSWLNSVYLHAVLQQRAIWDST